MLTFCQAQQADISTLAAIDAQAFEFAWTVGEFQGSFDAGHNFLVLKDGDEIVGYAVTMQIFEQVEILTIAVAPSHQGKGLGTLLLTEMHARVMQKGGENVFLEVRVSNAPAQALYRKMGYVEISRRKGYYPTKNGREDAIVMQKNLIENDL